MGEDLGAVDVPERSAQGEGGKNQRDEKAEKRPLHRGGFYAPPSSEPYGGAVIAR